MQMQMQKTPGNKVLGFRCLLDLLIRKSSKEEVGVDDVFGPVSPGKKCFLSRTQLALSKVGKKVLEKNNKDTELHNGA